MAATQADAGAPALLLHASESALVVSAWAEAEVSAAQVLARCGQRGGGGDGAGGAAAAEADVLRDRAAVVLLQALWETQR